MFFAINFLLKKICELHESISEYHSSFHKKARKQSFWLSYFYFDCRNKTHNQLVMMYKSSYVRISIFAVSACEAFYLSDAQKRSYQLDLARLMRHHSD